MLPLSALAGSYLRRLTSWSCSGQHYSKGMHFEVAFKLLLLPDSSGPTQSLWISQAFEVPLSEPLDAVRRGSMAT